MPQKEPLVLFDDGHHRCLAFNGLVEGEGVQANQFLIVHGEHAMLLDPGGELTFTPLNIALGRFINLRNLDYVFASHQDPDIIASLPRWLAQTNCKVVCSRLWSRFFPHLISTFVSEKLRASMEAREVSIPDQGGELPLGEVRLKILPAHYLHSVGNLQVYDPVSKILFSGDMGASVVNDLGDGFVADFDQHVRFMEGFHKRYMCANTACRFWANMVRGLEVEMLVPQHGLAFRGREMVHRFLDWISRLPCGVDLITQDFYRVP